MAEDQASIRGVEHLRMTVLQDCTERERERERGTKDSSITSRENNTTNLTKRLLSHFI